MPDISQATADKAATIQARFNSQVTSIRDDRGLTPEGKQRSLAQAYLRADEEMTKLRESWQGSTSTDSVTLARDIFGAASTAGADAISARDADDRATRLEQPNEALELLIRSEENGDGVLARAIAQHAYRNYNQQGDILGRHWATVLDKYLETRPDVAEKLEKLSAARRDSVTNNLRAGMVFSLHKPRELDRAGNLQAVAAGGL